MSTVLSIDPCISDRGSDKQHVNVEQWKDKIRRAEVDSFSVMIASLFYLGRTNVNSLPHVATGRGINHNYD